MARAHKEMITITPKQQEWLERHPRFNLSSFVKEALKQRIFEIEVEELEDF